MAAATPHVHNRLLIYHDEMRTIQIPLESQSWWDWLSEAGTTTFRFSSSPGHYTARRECKHGKWYWNAYRKQQGKLAKVYLGKSEELTEQRLLEVAHKVTERLQSFLNTSPSNVLSHDETENKAFLPNMQRQKKLPAHQSLQKVTKEEQNLFFTLKLVPPFLRTNLVVRSRLIEAVNNAVKHVLTLICASAGSGKSTLLGTWYSNPVNISRAWISLDEEDNEPSRFWMALIDALQSCFPAVGRRALTMLRSPQPLAIEAISGTQMGSLLTERERDVLHLLTLGLSNRQIASELVIAVSTVKWYLKQIYMKLNIHNRMQVVIRARELHLL